MKANNSQTRKDKDHQLTAGINPSLAGLVKFRGDFDMLKDETVNVAGAAQSQNETITQQNSQARSTKNIISRGLDENSSHFNKN